MSDAVLEKVIEEVKSLTPKERAQLQQLLSELSSNSQIKPTRVSLKPPAPVIDRTREMQWLEDHRAEFAGQWVALHGDHLLTHSFDAREVFAAARQSGIERPLIIQVEPADALPFAGW